MQEQKDRVHIAQNPVKDKQPHLLQALLLLFFIIGILLLSVLHWKTPLHSAMLVALLATCLFALGMGYHWSEIQDMMLAGIGQASILLVLMPVIGMVVGTWIAGGIVPAMIYYGIKIINPEYFFVTASVITAGTAIAIGTSWGTASTIGLAVFGVGRALGVSLPLLVGSIVSSLFFGEAMSPLASSANLASSISEMPLSQYFRHQRLVAAMVFLLSLTISSLLADFSAIGGAGTAATLQALTNSFTISPILLLPPAIVLVLAWRGVAVLPSLAVGGILGSLAAIVYQHHSVARVLNVMYHGPGDQTAVAVQGLAGQGGMEAMLSIVLLLLFSLGMAGILEGIGVLRTIVKACIPARVNPAVWLPVIMLLTGIGLSAVAGSQTLAIVLLGKMFLPEFKQRGLSKTIFGSCIMASSVVVPPLIAWNINGLFLTRLFGVPTTAYMRYAFFCYLLPLFVFILHLLNPWIDSLARKEHDCAPDYKS